MSGSSKAGMAVSGTWDSPVPHDHTTDTKLSCLPLARDGPGSTVPPTLLHPCFLSPGLREELSAKQSCSQPPQKEAPCWSRCHDLAHCSSPRGSEACTTRGRGEGSRHRWPYKLELSPCASLPGLLIRQLSPSCAPLALAF